MYTDLAAAEGSPTVTRAGWRRRDTAHAVCLDPPTLVLEFVGESYKYLERCTMTVFLDSPVSIAGRLEYIQGKGVVHNDLKVNNITFSGGYDNPVFHIIDCGFACRAGKSPSAISRRRTSISTRG